MTYGFPEAWLSLGGLLIPIIIHLLSKRKKKIVQFGTINFLEPSESAASKSIYISDFWVLLSRLFLIAAIIFLMSKLLIEDKDQRRQVIYVEDKIINNDSYASLNSIWAEEDLLKVFTFERRNEKEDVEYYPSAWNLIYQVNKLQDSVTVYTHSLQKNFKGTPAQLEQHIKWNIVPIRLPENKIQADEIQKQLNIYIGDNELSQNRFLNLLNSIASELPYPISWTATIDSADIQVILRHQITDRSIPTIRYVQESHPLKYEQRSSDEILITGSLSQEELLNSNLPLRLAAYFNSIANQSELNDHRTLVPENSKFSVQKGGAGNKVPLNIMWWLTIIPVILLERFISYKAISA